MSNRMGPKWARDFPELSGVKFKELDQRLRRYLRSRISDPELLDDVTQQTYANVIAALSRGDDIPQLSAYLFRAACNVHTDMCRQRNSWRRIVVVDSGVIDEEEYDHDSSPDDPQEIAAAIQELDACLNQLTEREKRIMFLRCWAENAVQKIAEEYHLKVGTARKYSDRAAAKFRGFINGK